MKPVFQEYDRYSDDGSMKPDCLRACVASLFELHISQVPHFIMFPDDQYWDVFKYFIWSIGYCWKDTGHKGRHSFEDAPAIGGYHLACVRTGEKPRDTHVVIIDTSGLVVHDPNGGEIWKGKNIIESGDMIWWSLIEKQST